MTKVVGVRFRNVGKIYYFSPKDYEIKTGDHVIVETARGIEYGKVVLAPREVGEEDVVHPLKEVLRVATKEDDEREAQNICERISPRLAHANAAVVLSTVKASDVNTQLLSRLKRRQRQPLYEKPYRERG